MTTDRDRLHDLIIAVRLAEQALSMMQEELDEIRATVARLQEASAVRTALETQQREAASTQVIRRGQHLSLTGQIVSAVMGATAAVLVWLMSRAWEAWRH